MSVAVPSSASLVARDLTKSFGPRLVLDRVSLTVGPRRRIGVVAPNGAGKTTLLRLLARLDTPDSGTVAATPPGASVGYLPQEPDRRPGETLRKYLARRTGIAGAEGALDLASTRLAAADPGADEAYAAALERYLALGAPDFEARLGEVAADLGLPARLLGEATAVLSGGEAARASLTAILLSRFDVFLLDEPTNDLDFAGLARLEAFLDALPAGAVIVSHDRAFLDRTVTSVLEIDEHTHRATLFEGGWAAYLEERATARRHAEEAYEDYLDHRGRLVDRARRQRQWSREGVARVKRRRGDEPDKNLRMHRKEKSEQLAAKARASDRALERLEARAPEKPWEGWDLRLTIAGTARSGAVVARLAGATVERGTFTLGPVDLEIGFGERVAIVGVNGSGKTTLLGALLGHLDLAAGTRWFGPGVVVGELEQTRTRFGGDESLLDAFGEASGLVPQEARTLLAKFGLGAEAVTRPGATLSPGERTRAGLALFMARGVNCLVLDEPTNHLDLPAIEQLEQGLDGYEGTLLVVTHDRALLGSLSVTRRLTVDAGRVVLDEPRG